MEHKYLSKEDLHDSYLRRVELVKVIDGDTLDLYIRQGFDQGFEDRTRLFRVDTPEKKGVEATAGLWVREKVISWLGSDPVLWMHSLSYDRDRYGRIISDIYKSDGECLNVWLLNNAYGWPTDDKGYLIGNRDITRLKLPKGISDQVLLEQRG